jgi:hypothetical protein
VIQLLFILSPSTERMQKYSKERQSCCEAFWSPL